MVFKMQSTALSNSRFTRESRVNSTNGEIRERSIMKTIETGRHPTMMVAGRMAARDLGAKAEEIAKRFIADDRYRADVLDYALQRAGNETSLAIGEGKSYFVGYEMGEQFLGDDFISPAEVEASALKVVYSDTQRTSLQESFPNSEQLEQLHRQGWMLIPSDPQYPRVYWMPTSKAGLINGSWVAKAYHAVRGS